jgi:hypothetical protein
VKYLLAVHSNSRAEGVLAGLTQAQRAAAAGARTALLEDLADTGELVVSAALADPSEGRRVLTEAGRVTTYGPFPEVTDYLVGFYLVECEGIDCAMRHAARIPEAALGGMVEVRPVLGPCSSDL